jgi:hypothetical protein
VGCYIKAGGIVVSQLDIQDLQRIEKKNYYFGTHDVGCDSYVIRRILFV